MLQTVHAQCSDADGPRVAPDYELSGARNVKGLPYRWSKAGREQCIGDKPDYHYQSCPTASERPGGQAALRRATRVALAQATKTKLQPQLPSPKPGEGKSFAPSAVDERSGRAKGFGRLEGFVFVGAMPDGVALIDEQSDVRCPSALAVALLSCVSLCYVCSALQYNRARVASPQCPGMEIIQEKERKNTRNLRRCCAPLAREQARWPAPSAPRPDGAHVRWL